MDEVNGKDEGAPAARADDAAGGNARAEREAKPAREPAIAPEDAVARLEKALLSLEGVVDAHLEHHVDNAAAAAEVQRLNADRARLARSLDEAEARAGRLDEANREVSRRLVGAMEAIRAFVESGEARTRGARKS